MEENQEAEAASLHAFTLGAGLNAEEPSERRLSACTRGRDQSRHRAEIAFREAALVDRGQGRMRRRRAGPLPMPIPFPPQRPASRWKFGSEMTQIRRLHGHRHHPDRYREAERRDHEGFSPRLQRTACASGHGQNRSLPR